MAVLWAVGVAAVLASAAPGAVLLWRLRQSRRMKAAMNAYAERESLREPRQVARRGVRV